MNRSLEIWNKKKKKKKDLLVKEAMKRKRKFETLRQNSLKIVRL